MDGHPHLWVVRRVAFRLSSAAADRNALKHSASKQSPQAHMPRQGALADH